MELVIALGYIPMFILMVLHGRSRYFTGRQDERTIWDRETRYSRYRTRYSKGL